MQNVANEINVRAMLKNFGAGGAGKLRHLIYHC